MAGNSKGCGVTDEVVDWMERVQNSAEPETFLPAKSRHATAESPGHKYSKEANFNSISNGDDDDDDYDNKETDDRPGARVKTKTRTRPKRAAKPKEENKNTCSLFIQTDPLIWRHIFEQVSGNMTTCTKLGSCRCSLVYTRE